ncbi:precorrin-6y C5,15-methyltransferase (decarboxylating) subunit CbiE [Chloroflexota bacterium]
MPEDKVYIIGVSFGGPTSLLPEIHRLVNDAEIVFGGKRLLDMFPSLSGQKIVIKNNLDEAADLIKANLGHKRMIVLASGDPGFYGIARYLTDKLGKDALEIIPNVSAMQLAFARIKESWDDAILASVHSRPIEDIIDMVRSSHKIGIFTDDEHTPGKIAGVLQRHGIDNCRAYVCQDLGSEQENIIATDLYSLKKAEFSPLNVLILIRDAQEAGGNVPTQQLLGIPDERFHRLEGGLITKMEVRAVSLARLCLTANSIVWDIGAGSGGISIEASLLASKGSVFAIEKNSDAVAVIRENIRRFDRHNIKVIQALAPEYLERLPDPDAVFIGGSGGRMGEILRVICDRLQPGGRIVINAATLETLHTAVESLKANRFAVEVTLVNVAHSKDILNLTRLEALNPVFVIGGGRETERANGE